MKILITSFLLLGLINITSVGQDLFTNSLKSLLENTNMKGASSGISVIESGTGKIIAGLNDRTSLIPASVLKTVTSATALEVFGADFRFRTILGYTGTAIKETKILKGNLLVLGGGDPTLGSEYFPENDSSDFIGRWVDELITLGISTIDGNLVVDGGIYLDDDIPGTWVWDDLGNYYGAGAYGITVYDNLFRIVFKSGPAGQLTEIVRTIPEISGLEIKNEVKASAVNRDNAYVFGSPWGGRRVVKGTIPENREMFAVKAALPEPARFLGEQMRNRLAGKGIRITGQVLVQTADTTGFHAVFIQQSPPLSEITKVLNHESVNLFAEQLLKHISLTRKGTRSVTDGTGFMEQYWQTKGLDVSGMFIEDGSGLSHYNAISAGQLTWILNYMKAQSPANQAFYESLPTAGKGTLAVFNPSDFPGNCLKAKSGSLTRVRNYVGFLKTEKGNELVFAFIFNNFSLSQSELTREIGKLLVTLRQQY